MSFVLRHVYLVQQSVNLSAETLTFLKCVTKIIVSAFKWLDL